MKLPRLFIAGLAFGALFGLGVAGLVSGGKPVNAPGASGPQADAGRAGAGPGARSGEPAREGRGAQAGARPGGQPGRPGPGQPGGGAWAQRGAGVAVAFAEVEAATVGRTVEAIGTARALRSVTIVSEVAGRIAAVKVKPGDLVKAGDVLFQIDDEPQRIALARARAQYPVAKENAERFARLSKDDAASAIEAEDAFNQLKTLEADLQASQFALEQRRIVAPFNGVVGLFALEPGGYIGVGETLVTLDDTSAIIIEFAVPQEVAADIVSGQDVSARLASSNARAITGVVSGIDSRVDPVSRTLRIEATFQNAVGELIPGATFAVSTTSDGASALSVPGLAVQWDRTGSYVWAVDAEGVARRAAVTILQRTENMVLVSGDIAAGDFVIAEGGDRIRPGMTFPPPAATSRLGAGAGSTGSLD